MEYGSHFRQLHHNVVARRRIAIDYWPFPRSAASGVETIVGNVAELGALPDDAVDFGCTRNLFQHLTQADFSHVLQSLPAQALSP